MCYKRINQTYVYKTYLYLSVCRKTGNHLENYMTSQLRNHDTHLHRREDICLSGAIVCVASKIDD
jgi:hypothetical protein